MRLRTQAVAAALTVLAACAGGTAPPGIAIGNRLTNATTGEVRFTFVDGDHCYQNQCLKVDKTARTMVLDDGTTARIPASVDLTRETISESDGRLLINLIHRAQVQARESESSDSSNGGGGSAGSGGLS